MPLHLVSEKVFKRKDCVSRRNDRDGLESLNSVPWVGESGGVGDKEELKKRVALSTGLK